MKEFVKLSKELVITFLYSVSFALFLEAVKFYWNEWQFKTLRVMVVYLS